MPARGPFSKLGVSCRREASFRSEATFCVHESAVFDDVNSSWPRERQKRLPNMAFRLHGKRVWGGRRCLSCDACRALGSRLEAHGRATGNRLPRRPSEGGGQAIGRPGWTSPPPNQPAAGLAREPRPPVTCGLHSGSHWFVLESFTEVTLGID